MMRRRTPLLFLVLPLALMFGACDDLLSERYGSVSLLLTDEPGDVIEAWVTIDRIYLQPGEDEDENDAQRVDLLPDAVTTELLKLADDVEWLAQNMAVPAGFYEQLRVVVSAACLIVEGETEDSFEVYATAGFAQCGEATGTLQAPSLSQTGIKVVLAEDGFEVQEGQQIVLLDFDVSQSFGHAAGGSNQWVMHPVIIGSEVEAGEAGEGSE